MAIERTVSRWKDDRWESLGETLADFRSAQAYVLLGEAGSGKTTAFVEERGDGDDRCYVTARHFICRDPGSHPEWKRNVLFIDGLDEQRAGGGDPREPLDEVLRRIEWLGQPRFRLSCREESWLGRSDLREISSVANGERVHLLRLDPLSRDHTREILISLRIKEPDDFLWNASDRGLDAFLQNPLLLGVLAKAVTPESADPWPDTQRATFERACKELVRDLNEEYQDAWDGAPCAGQELVAAAGRLCAIILLSDKLGWSRMGPGNGDYPPLSDAGAQQGALKFVLDTKLFVGSAETGRRPRHRRIAEFLAARYLDKVIREGLPATRVLALMAGGDGLVAPDLQGASAWLAAMNGEARDLLIDADPIGVAFGGDAGGLDHEDAERLLTLLERRLDYRWIMPSWASVDSLLTGPARVLLWRRLRDPDRSDGRQALVGLLLQGLSPLSGSEAGWIRSPRVRAAEARSPLLDVVRDDTWRHYVRRIALRALIHVLQPNREGSRVLLRLLRELSDGRVRRDDRDELRGELLASLYPAHIRPEEIWDYLPLSTLPYGKGVSFWTEDLVESSSPEQVKGLLEELLKGPEELLPAMGQHGLESLVFRLLSRALELFGEATEVAELFRWFELVEADGERAGLVPAHCQHLVLGSRQGEEQKRIHEWLRDHPDIQLGLVLEGLERNASAPGNQSPPLSVGTKFLGDDAPAGFRRWCLRKAIEMGGTQSRVVKELRWWTTIRNEHWGQPLDDDEIASMIRDAPWLQDLNKRRLAERAQQADEMARLQESPPYTTVRERQARYVASIREQLATLEAGEGPPETLYELGRIYVNGLEAGGPDRARADLNLRLGSDRHVVDAVTSGFRRLVGRNDLPTMEDIIRLRERKMTSWYEPPLLAGLAEDERAGVEAFDRLDEAGLRRALAFYLLSRLPTTRHPIPGNFSHSVDCRPGWYRRALHDRPEAVAEVFIAVNRVRLRAKDLPDQHLYDMAVKDDYAAVARFALPKMFKPFPSHCAGDAQLTALHRILLAAIRYKPDRELTELVTRRLARSEMDVAQRVYWLAAGSLVAPDECLPRLIDFLSVKEEARVHHLVDFLVPETRPLPNQEWPTAHLAGLVRAVGAKLHSPWDDVPDSTRHFMGGDSFATGIKAESLVNGWIKTLAHQVDGETSAALADLAGDPALAKWSGKLRRARDEQAERLRAATRRPPTVSEVREALQGGLPGSAADLAALVADRLRQLGKRTRNGSSDAWIHYWDRDRKDPKRRRVISPMSEDACRKVLVWGLQPLLKPHGVVATQDEQVAEEKHPDIMTHHHPHAVPIEIKHTASRDIWTAASDQLHKRYCRDPRSDGYGIYLVLWFDADDLKPPPSGRRPESPGELGSQLEAALAPQHRHKIEVIVMDVSAPAGRRTESSGEFGGHGHARSVGIKDWDEARVDRT